MSLENDGERVPTLSPEIAGTPAPAYHRLMDDQLRFLLLIIERLDDLEIPYMVTGSIALTLYGTPRMTRNIDLVVELDHTHVQSLVDRFPDCVVYVDDVADAVKSRRMFNIIHSEWLVKADFIVRKSDEYRRVEFERRREAGLDGRSIFVVSPEDLLLSKLCWAKESGSAMQTQDVQAIVGSAVELDRPYLEKWARVLGVDLPERDHE